MDLHHISKLPIGRPPDAGIMLKAGRNNMYLPPGKVVPDEVSCYDDPARMQQWVAFALGNRKTRIPVHANYGGTSGGIALNVEYADLVQATNDLGISVQEVCECFAHIASELTIRFDRSAGLAHLPRVKTSEMPRGIRLWNVDRRSGNLRSLVAPYEWEGPVQRMNGALGQGMTPQAGFYAKKVNLRNLRWAFGSLKGNIIIGLVSLFGEVVEATQGYRGQCCRIDALWAPQGEVDIDHRDILAQRYDCDVHWYEPRRLCYHSGAANEYAKVMADRLAAEMKAHYGLEVE